MHFTTKVASKHFLVAGIDRLNTLETNMLSYSNLSCYYFIYRATTVVEIGFLCFLSDSQVMEAYLGTNQTSEYSKSMESD